MSNQLKLAKEKGCTFNYCISSHNRDNLHQRYTVPLGLKLGLFGLCKSASFLQASSLCRQLFLLSLGLLCRLVGCCHLSSSLLGLVAGIGCACLFVLAVLRRCCCLLQPCPARAVIPSVTPCGSCIVCCILCFGYSFSSMQPSFLSGASHASLLVLARLQSCCCLLQLCPAHAVKPSGSQTLRHLQCLLFFVWCLDANHIDLVCCC